MNKEDLESRIKQFEETKLQSIANINAIIGAIQECQYWIDKINKPEVESPKSIE